jgi:hypothetical protein
VPLGLQRRDLNYRFTVLFRGRRRCCCPVFQPGFRAPRPPTLSPVHDVNLIYLRPCVASSGGLWRIRQDLALAARDQRAEVVVPCRQRGAHLALVGAPVVNPRRSGAVPAVVVEDSLIVYADEIRNTARTRILRSTQSHRALSRASRRSWSMNP